MAITTANMGLKGWDLPGDVFSHTDLVANWNAIDAHDHTSGKGIQIPTAGITNLAVTGPKIAANAIDASKVQDGSITDAELASPVNGAYKSIGRQYGHVFGGQAANTWFFGSGSTVANGGSLGSDVQSLQLNAADYAVPNKTTVCRLRIAWATNAVATGMIMSLGLSPVTATGGSSGSITYTVGPFVTGSTITLTTPAANSHNAVASADFAFPASDQYFIMVTTPSLAPTNSGIYFWGDLQYRNV